MRNLALLLTLALPACGAKNPTNSDLDFAHFPAASAFGGPLGRLEALRMAFKSDFDSVRICVETGKERIADDQILLESKLAYAAWLSAAGGYDESDWERFEFVSQGKCKSDDKAFAGFVMLAEQDNLAPGEELTGPFQEQTISCETNGSWKSCKGNGITLGWGGPGSLTYWYQGNPNKWTKLEAYRPSPTTLSPHVSWLSLPEDLTRSKADGLTDDKKTELIAAYNKLKDANAPSMSDLAGFIAKLESVEATASEDPIFKALAKSFYSSSATTLNKSYRGERGAFSTLLHEVGHQYGMDHADHPNQDSVTGQSTTATQNADGQWVSDIASMAYGLPYLYLTQDDQAGIQSDVTAVRAYLTAHQ